MSDPRDRTDAEILAAIGELERQEPGMARSRSVGIPAPRELLESLVDADDCRFDHHGGCQAHGYLALEPGELCPQAELKALLAAPSEGTDG